ncbi:hypothetical protein NSK_000359 [Nannochloropsis salina CCMP1776]|uniref:SET domain-containing protein n=1 Tax=Nannochloropsis salina CCMP1776 TaxID=1027361 RepID=A0A4D9DEF7_9STRA|nr:hypothetical protein NSK_000359 [Nannochloropsis salina CCMP1776]|eukprot:TFJ88005.1 hypothetical protein NSK_000359 [Nannochloropsis salina CCMP1776]
MIWTYKEGTEILRTYHKHQIDALPPSPAKVNLVTYSYMLDDDLYGSTPNPEEDPSYFFNHSCAPNCWYSGDNLIVAMRDIRMDEHIVYDYAMTETEASLHAGLVCLCGAGTKEGGREGGREEGVHCRGVLRFDDWRRASWAHRYRKHVTSYVHKKMEENSWLDPRIVLRYKKRTGDGGEEEGEGRQGEGEGGGEGGMEGGGEGGDGGRGTGLDKGLVATAPVQKGELVLVFVGKVVDLDGLLASGRRNMELSLQVHDSLWQIPSSSGPETSDFVNHSCDANAGMADSTSVIAIRNIAAGEEITIDYATVNSGLNTSEGDNFTCRCQARDCRGLVTSRDWMLPKVQEKYWPHFPPFVRRLILSQVTASGKEGGREGGGKEGVIYSETKGMIPSSMSIEELS